MLLSQIYLPVAELALSPFILLAVGVLVGVTSSLLGVGGAFLATPILIFLGVSPAVAAGTSAMLVLATAVANSRVHVKRGGIDYAFVSFMIGGGLIGSFAGVMLFWFLKRLGYIDLITKLAFVILLTSIGVLVLSESIRHLYRTNGWDDAPSRKQSGWVKSLPIRFFFRTSRMYRSLLLPIGIGLITGVLSGFIGIGGGFLLVPALIYIARMPLALVVGTSMFQMCFIAFSATFLQSSINGTVDVIAALLLIIGSIIGTRFGNKWSHQLNGLHLRLLFGIVLLLVAGQTFYEAIRVPSYVYSLEPVGWSRS